MSDTEASEEEKVVERKVKGDLCEERHEWGGGGYDRESRRAEGVGVLFGKWFTKILRINYFQKFYKGFSGQRKLFSI